MRVDAIVLAAGEGRRMGGGGKALARIMGITFLERVLESCREGGCRRAWVVVRPEDRETIDHVRRLAEQPGASRCPIEVVHNPDAELGMFSSVRVGLRAVLERDAAASTVVFPVDFPMVHHTTVHALAHAIGKEPTQEPVVVRPRYHDRTGHPIVLSCTVAHTLVDASADSRLDDEIQRAETEVVDVTVVDIGILRNLNRLSDLNPNG